MKVKVSPSIGKRELNIATIGNYSVKANTQIVLTDEQYAKSDIQAAIRKGMLEIVEGETLPTDSGCKLFKVTNVSGRPLGIGSFALIKDEHKFVAEKEIQNTSVQSALRSKLITIEEDSRCPAVIKTAKPVAEKAIEEEPQRVVYRPKDTKNTMQAWDGEGDRLVDKKQSEKVAGIKRLKKPTVKDDGETQVGEVDFTEPAEGEESKPIRLKRKLTASSKPTKGKKSPRPIAPVGEAREKASQLDAELDDNNLTKKDDVTFVDEEQELARIKAFRQRQKNQNNEIE